jgi:predicted glycoside hydrolase/deacetylase ChbG (UPF0249 family)
MSPRLIINADDFGLTTGINRAIAELHQAGVLSSATLMANGPAFDDAVAIAHRNSRLGIGCHIVLTDGVPVSHPESIPTLIGADGKTFRPSLLDFVQAALRGNIAEEDVRREALAQVQKLQRAGIDVTHFDTHKHAHVFPVISRPLLHVAERVSIGAIRNPFEQAWSLELGHVNRTRQLQVRLLRYFERNFREQPPIRSGHVVTTDGTVGISATGHLNAQALGEILGKLPNGVWELVCHPGYNDRDLDAVRTRLRSHREVERHALLSAVPAILSQRDAPELIQYGSLGSVGALRDVGQFVPATGYEVIERT